MNLQIFIRAKNFTKFLLCWSVLTFAAVAQAGWNIDLSRRQKDIRSQELKAPMPEDSKKSFFTKLFAAETPANDVVILNTEKGFLPNTVRLRKGVKYKVHVVNVNEGERNVSFILDAFSEHHATYYGSIKSFEVHPQKEGVFSFSCPETAIEGSVVVFKPQMMPQGSPRAMRMPASN